MSPEGNNEKGKKKIRTTFSVDQISELENNFVQKKYLTSAERAELATELGVTLQQVGAVSVCLGVRLSVCPSRS